MSSSPWLNILLLPILVASLFTNPMSDNEIQEKINYVCRQMEEFGFCNQTFNENLKSTTTDYVGLTQITIEQAITNSTNTHAFVQQLLESATSEPLRNALIECKNAYSTVVQSFHEAMKYFEQKEYSSMVKSEMVAPRAQSDCSSRFSISPYRKNPLADRNREMRIIIAMAIVTGHQLDVYTNQNMISFYLSFS
ncbi:hypothetical protein JCGZ_15714 [Jatropha curcas]|uniref:Pectinesterase inhibitor domain-containing protein n=1 Tax=Jatropha curcas TaxID=180498 RepID=A0A067KYT8_JATCU|nr:uncharacterized protein LOC105630548 [Jatropha curcas]KDP41307.1 hypothetical protein JCGZ_15714 [Jatropha curcas]